MNDISKRGEWDHLPHAQKEKEEDEKVEKGHKDVDDVSGEVRNVDDEKYSQGKYNSPHSEVGIQSGEIKPHPKPVKGEHTEDTKYTSQAGEELGSGKEGRKRFESDSKKSDEIVEKAIELINEAYGEMKSTDFRKLKPTYEGDTKEAKKGDGFEKIAEKFKPDKEGKIGGIKVPDSPNNLAADRARKESAEAKSPANTPEQDKAFEKISEKFKDGGTATTSSEGGFNHVYSDVHEAKRQKQEQ